jgi:hypothetical protein
VGSRSTASWLSPGGTDTWCACLRIDRACLTWSLPMCESTSASFATWPTASPQVIERCWTTYRIAAVELPFGPRRRHVSAAGRPTRRRERQPLKRCEDPSKPASAPRTPRQPGTHHRRLALPVPGLSSPRTHGARLCAFSGTSHCASNPVEPGATSMSLGSTLCSTVRTLGRLTILLGSQSGSHQ